MTKFQKTLRISTLLLISFLSLYSTLSHGQDKPLTYYLPDIEYNDDIPTPEEVLGFQIGNWHVSHDQILYYMRTLSKVSDRINITTYAKSHEDRPLIYLTISAPQNLERLEDIKSKRLQLCDYKNSDDVDISNLPVVIYQGYSIHGNEPSGANASLLNAYYLAAAQDEYTLGMLRNVIILLDPAFNPDGIQRFSSWVNMHKNKNMTSDSRDREYNESWPRGRTNHYWFDLNRDWLLLTHPESRGRLKTFHEWKPDILTDHHEMGTNSTFFFQPGIPSRTNPITPQKNQALTEKIGYFHAEALDNIGSLYFTKANYDDYYYGKGSTYPDINGGVGILFEQASSRGHIQESANGLLEFPFTIRNQVATSLSTQKAGLNLRIELLEYKRRFFKDAFAEAKSSLIKGYIFSDTDHSKLRRFTELLQSHQIQVYGIGSTVKINDHEYLNNSSFFVPSEQQQFKLVKTIFEKVTEFPDSIFYDVSAWTLPLAFDLQYDEVSSDVMKKIKLAGEVSLNPVRGRIYNEDPSYAYMFRWDDYFAPAVLYRIQDYGLKTKVLHKEFSVKQDEEILRFSPGSIVIPIHNQNKEVDELTDLLKNLANEYPVDYYGIMGGYGDNDMTLGHPSVSSLEKPNVLLLIGGSVSSQDAGEFWHLMDTRYNIPVTKVDVNSFSPRILSRYNTLVMVNGSYRELSESDVEGIEAWVNQGRRIILFRGAINWARNNNLIRLQTKSNKNDDSNFIVNYSTASANLGSRVLGGAIFDTKVDLTHPLLYGYHDESIPVFRRGTNYYNPTSNKYATPITFRENARLSGFVPSGTERDSDNAAVVSVHGKGQGRIIAISDNLNFRGVWWGGSKVVANAINFGSTISRNTIQYEED